MSFQIRKYTTEDLPEMRQIWNVIVEEANAFPQDSGFSSDGEAGAFFAAQTYTGVAEHNGKISGLYILHPNNIGRCASIANASFAVLPGFRGMGVGKSLVEDCLRKGKEFGFHVLQFNAVVASNLGAIHLYEKLGFERLGQIPACFQKKDGSYEDLLLFFHRL